MRQHLAVSVIAVALSVPVAWAAGTITFDETLISVGVAPDRGRLVLRDQPLVSELPTVPAPRPPATVAELIDPFSAASRTLPARGGGDESLRFSEDTTLSSGTYDVSTLTIDAGVRVTCDGPVLVRATGDVLVEGSVQVLGSDAGFIVLCDGDFTARAVAGFSAPSFRTGPRLARLAIDALGDVSIAGHADGSSDCEFYGSQGVLISARSEGALLDVSDAEFSAGPHGVYLRSEGDILAERTTMTQSGGGMYVIAFGGDATLLDSEIDTGPLGLGLLASGGFVIGDGSSVVSRHLELRAESGRFELSGDSLLETRGTQALVRAGSDVVIEGDSRFRHVGNTRATEVVSEDGSLLLGPGESLVETTGGFPLVVRVAEHVSVGAGAAIATIDGDIEIDAGDDIVVEGSVSSRFGAVALRAGRDVRFEASGDVDALAGTDVRLAAGADVTVASISATAGPVDVVATRRLRANGPISAAAAIDLVARDGDVNLTDASVTTLPAETQSGTIRVETWAGDTATIDLTRASIATGRATDKSGDILVLVSERPPEVAPDPPEPPQPPLPPEVNATPIELTRFRASRVRRDIWRLRIRGSIESEVDSAGLGSELILTVGGESRTLRLSRRTRKGASVYVAKGVKVKVWDADSDATIRIKVRMKTDLADRLPRSGDGSIEVRLQAGDLVAAASAELRRGRLSVAR